MTVAVLFAHRKSTYKAIPGLDVWDEDRDARLWPGGCQVVAHPPCRGWGRFAKFAKIAPHEKQLARDAVRHIRAGGGVLEHPRHSGLWEDQKLPRPGDEPDEWGGFTLEVEQVRWGHPCIKATWLYVAGCAPEDVPPIPPWREPTHAIDNNRKARQAAPHTTRAERGELPHLPKSKREHTPPDFAAWLVEVASRCSPPVWRERAKVIDPQPDLFDRG